MMSRDAESLEQLRAEIQRLDKAIVALLAERLSIVRSVGELKRAQGMSVIDPAREAAVVANVAAHARALGLPEDDVRELFWRIMAMARREQQAE